MSKPAADKTGDEGQTVPFDDECAEHDASASFQAIGYQIINARRLEHLASLGLKTHFQSVLELGAGVGDLTSYFINRECQVLSTEARPASMRILQRRYPTVETRVVDIEGDDPTPLPRREIVFCYGLLYHLRDPELALQRMAAATKTLLLLETCVSPSADEDLETFEEMAEHPAAGVHGRGCYPSRTWIRKRLKRHFKHVYLPTTQPNHPQFPIDWASARQKRGDTKTRAIFVAAHRPIENPLLSESVPEKQVRCP